MRIGRDIERLIRQFVRQKLGNDYIRHYLLEEYQLEPKQVDELFDKLGIGVKKDVMGMPIGGKKADDGKVSKQRFY